MAACAGLAVTLWATLAGDAQSEAGSAKPIRVTSTLPEWIAPGGLLIVRGWAGSNEVVTLRTGQHILARTRAGARGGYGLRARPAGTGWKRLRFVAGGVSAPLGSVLVRSLRLAAVGDVTFGEGVGVQIAARGPRYPWLSVASVLRRADVAVANLETVVSTRGTPVPNKEFRFRGPPQALRATARFAGVDVVSVANNHSLDYGRTAFLDTLRNAHRFGLETIGGGRNVDRARRPVLVRLGGIRIALLGFSDVRPLGFDAGPGTPGATPAFSNLIAHDVRRAKATNDVVVVYFHWGMERKATPTSRQRSFARTAFDAGATVVLGAHPHVLQPRERKGRRFVAWSLGNFVFTGTSTITRRTGILKLGLGRRGVLDTGFRRAEIVSSQPRLR